MRLAVLFFLVALCFSQSLAAEKCSDYKNVYAVGNLDNARPFIFTLSGGWTDCAKGILAESKVTNPAWMTFNKFPTLFDPLKLGSYGLRTVHDEGLWDGLESMTFAVNADTRKANGVDLDKTLVWHNYASETSRCDFLPDGLPTKAPKVWDKAIPVTFAGNAQANKVFYWESAEASSDAYTVRVMWDCATNPAQCSRVIGIQNKLKKPLYNVKIQLSFDPDISPRTSVEDLAMGATTRDAFKDVLLGYSTDITPERNSNKRGVLQPITNNPSKTTDCWPDANKPIAFNGKMCGDAGCSAQILMASVLQPDQIVTIQTDVKVFQGIAAGGKTELEVNKAAATSEANGRLGAGSAIFTCASASNVEGFPGNVIAFFTAAPKAPCKYDPADPNTASCSLPGDCPCRNGGTCQYTITGTCTCPDPFWGRFCQRTCNVGAYRGVEGDGGKCVCTRTGLKPKEQRWGAECSKPCECENDSLCDNDNGSCWCHNGGRGERCQFKGITCNL